MKPNFTVLKQQLAEIADLKAAAAVLEWDQQTFLPPGAEKGRARQIAALCRHLHRAASAPELGRTIDALEKQPPAPDTVEFALLRAARRHYDRCTRVPETLAEDLSATTAEAYADWLRAREEHDFRILAPRLEKIIELKRQYAALFAPEERLYDALLDDYEPGQTTAELDVVFAELRSRLPGLIDAVIAAQQSGPDFSDRAFPAAAQMAFSRDLVTAMGFDFQHGRLDLTEHPFTTDFGLDDVRITTHIDERDFLSCILSCVHECGHALYSLGIEPELNRTPLADGASLGFHESQSRLWENQVARSAAFWRAFLPHLHRYFPGQLADVSESDFLAAINRVRRSEIRIESDEVTYNCHILLRYDIEKELIHGRVRCADLPELWNEKMREYLHITPVDDTRGVLQDVHWPTGGFGYFPTYTIGNLLAAQLWELVHRELPGLDDRIAAGELQPLREWLRERVHRHGARYLPGELRQRLFGDARLQAGPFLRYLTARYLPEA